MSQKLIVPEEVLMQNIIALGKPGSGKSSKLRVLVEHLLRQKRPVCILDPKGDWWGLKLAADGKGAGFPVVIFGGDHGDIPITEHAGSLVAEIVAAGNHSCIIDLGGWMPGPRSRFFVDFASSLFKLPHPAMHLIIDECHNVAPQGKVLDPMAGKSLHWANRLASEGRSKGITIVAASQRPQKVHKDFLTTCETLIACRLIHELDRNAVKGWIDGCADPVLGRQVISELAQMSRTEAWVWSPEINFGPKRIAFPMFTTFDSFSPQASVVRRALPPPLGLDEIRLKLSDVLKEAEANDPAKLKARIAELEKANGIAGKEAKKLKELLQAAEAIIAMDKVKKIPDEAMASIDLFPILQEAITQINAGLADISRGISKIKGVGFMPKQGDYDLISNRNDGSRNQKTTQGTPLAAIQHRAAPMPIVTHEKPSGKPEMRVLNALAWWEKITMGPYSKVQVAAVAGYSPSSGGFGNLLGKLKSADLIEYPQPGMVELTAGGRMRADPVETATTSKALHGMIYEKLTAPQQRVLQVIIQEKTISKILLGQATDYSPTSGGFGNLLGQLRSLGLIDYPSKGVVQAEPFLYAVKD